MATWFKKVEAPKLLCCILDPVECSRCHALQKKCRSCHHPRDEYSIEMGWFICDKCIPEDHTSAYIVLTILATTVNLILGAVNFRRGHMDACEINLLTASISVVCSFLIASPAGYFES